jgi:two-component system chemotaxis response regulator CheB
MARGSAPLGLVVVGASAGGVEALGTLVGQLPPDLPATVLVTMHVPAVGTSALPAILERRGALPARHAQEGEELRAGEILVAPPDHHLVVDGARVRLTRGPQENGHRPAVDVLFRSAARSWGSRVIAVVLSGALDDGAAGVVAVKQRGGRCAVQSDAMFDGMPRAATRADHPDAELPASDMGKQLEAWLQELPELPEPEASSTDLMKQETLMAEMDPSVFHDPDRPGEPAGFGCPECAGALWRIEEGKIVRFRCRVGHAWSPESLLVRQTVALESALWMALRSLEEKAALNEELGGRAETAGHHRTAARFSTAADEARSAAELVRRLVVDLGDAEQPVAQPPSPTELMAGEVD